MEFEFDPEKSSSNKVKHGIDFSEAQALWNDPMLVVAPARTEDEPRFLAIGKIGQKHWSGVYVLRDTRMRLISVRRSRQREIDYYESA